MRYYKINIISDDTHYAGAHSNKTRGKRISLWYLQQSLLKQEPDCAQENKVAPENMAWCHFLGNIQSIKQKTSSSIVHPDIFVLQKSFLALNFSLS